MSIIWAFQNSDTITKQNWDMHVIWILIWFYLFLVLALLMLLFSIPSSSCSYFPMNGISCECICCFYHQIWNLRKWVSMTSLSVLDSYSSAAPSEFSIDHLKTRSWCSCQTGKWALSDGWRHALWRSQYHKPWFLFTAMQHFTEVTAKDVFWSYLNSDTLSELFAPTCRLRAGFPVLPGREWEALSQPPCGSLVRFMSASAAGSACKFRVRAGNLCRSGSAASPHPFWRFKSNRQTPRPVTPLQQHQGSLHAVAGRPEQLSVAENLVLKIIQKKCPLNNFKEKTEKCSGAIYEQKKGVKFT